jgi:nickel superoxide dismutase
MKIVRPVLRLIDRVSPPATVSAHCDIPCGIYDPYAAQIAALTVVRMNQLMEGVTGNDKAALNTLARHIAVKESHAELVKREVDIIWHDYFKPEHLDKFPDLHTTVWNLQKLASKNKVEHNLQAAWDLLAAVGAFAEKLPSNQAVGGELVVPA